jgi:mannose-6-phosphate isomerase-like protein (cupin superfamily)
MEKTGTLNAKMEIESSEITHSTAMHNFSKLVNGIRISDFNLIRFIVKPACESVQDQHAVKEYWYIAKGEGIIYINESEAQAKEGDVFFFDSHTTHLIRNSSAVQPLEILSIWW